jgi:hypothetical protein
MVSGDKEFLSASIEAIGVIRTPAVSTSADSGFDRKTGTRTSSY